MNEVFQESALFGVAISIFAFWIGYCIHQKWKYPFLNPLLIGMILVILFLSIFHIDYETYEYGAKYISYFISPATVCLAIPLYKQIRVLKKNWIAIITAIICGCVAHLFTVFALAALLEMDGELTLSLLSKSVTMAFALPITEEVGGISAVTIVGLTVAGLFGAVLGPIVMKILHITNPLAQGLGIGASSHAVGTSKAVEMGEVQAAMGTLAIAVTGFMTVIVVPIAVSFWKG